MPPVRRFMFLPTIAMLLVSAAACTGARPDDMGPDTTTLGDRALRTDRSEYRVERTAEGGLAVTIDVVYENRTGASASLATCRTPHPPVLQKRVEGEWVDVYNPPVLMCLGDPVVIPAGTTYEYSYRIEAFPRGANAFPQFEANEVPGVYRLRWAIQEEDGQRSADDRPAEDRPAEDRPAGGGVISNEFRLLE